MSNTITLTTETISVLKKLYDINQSLRIVSSETETDDDDNTHTVLRAKSQNNTMLARVQVNQEFPRDMNIYDLREFISAVGLVTDHEIDFSNESHITIKSKDGKQSLRYLEANPDMIGSYTNKDLPLKSEDAELLVTQEQLKSVLTAASTMKLGYVGFFADGESVELSSFELNNGDDRDTKKFNVTIGETEAKYRMFYNMSVHNVGVLLGEGDLTFTIAGKSKISRIDTETGKTFWIAMDDKSNYAG